MSRTAPMRGNANLLMSIEEAGRHFYGVGRTGAYRAFRRGEFIIVRQGRRNLVSVPGMLRKIEAGDPPEHRQTNGHADLSTSTANGTHENG